MLSETHTHIRRPSRNQTWAKVTIRSRGDTFIDIRPEGPPDKNVGMVEALGKAWSWRMPPQKWMPSTTTTSHQPERH